MAVMRMESLGAFLSGAYATLSMITPISVQATMESRMASTGLSPNWAMTSQETYAPTMMMSPWAKLSSKMMPYTIV